MLPAGGRGGVQAAGGRCATAAPPALRYGRATRSSAATYPRRSPGPWSVGRRPYRPDGEPATGRRHGDQGVPHPGMAVDRVLCRIRPLHRDGSTYRPASRDRRSGRRRRNPGVRWQRLSVPAHRAGNAVRRRSGLRHRYLPPEMVRAQHPGDPRSAPGAHGLPSRAELPSWEAGSTPRASRRGSHACSGSTSASESRSQPRWAAVSVGRSATKSSSSWARSSARPVPISAEVRLPPAL